MEDAFNTEEELVKYKEEAEEKAKEIKRFHRKESLNRRIDAALNKAKILDNN